MPFFEPGLEELLARQVAAGRLRFTDSYEEAGAFADLHFVCVGTPQLASSMGADVSYVDAAVDLAGAAPHPAVVRRRQVDRPGRHRRPARRAPEANAPAGADAELVWNPEFLREGFAVEDTLRPDRIVVGVASERAEKAMREFYAPITDTGIPIVVTDYATAELVKVSANAFLATKISFINAVGEVCEAAGADVVDLADAIGHDTRIGRRFLNAGVGFGGGCLPKDIRAFVHRAGELGVEDAMTFLRQVDDINLRQRQPGHPDGQGDGRRLGRRCPDLRVGRGVQARQRRRARLARRWRSPASCTCAVRRSASTTPRPTRPRRPGSPRSTYADSAVEAAAAPTWCCT